MGRIEEILSYYEGASAGILKNLRHMLMQGRLGGSGRMLMLPIDQGFEHGPGRSFAANPDMYDPFQQIERAVKFGLSGYAAPLGSLELVSAKYAGVIPTILKLNSNNRLVDDQEAPYPAWTASVDDALRLGCTAVGLTIYPGSDDSPTLFSEVAEVVAEARGYGLPTIIWAYPRGGALSGDDSMSLDVIGYSAHMAALLGAHIIKVKLPSHRVALDAQAYQQVSGLTLSERVKHIMQCAFNGKRIVLFSGGEAKDDNAVLEDVKAIVKGGGYGSMMARNLFQRSVEEAKKLADDVIKAYS